MRRAPCCFCKKGKSLPSCGSLELSGGFHPLIKSAMGGSQFALYLLFVGLLMMVIAGKSITANIASGNTEEQL